MATTPTVVQETSATTANKAPVLPMVIAIIFGVAVSVAVVGGAGYYLIHSGKLRLQTMPPTPPPAETKTHTVVLEPLLVNLADLSGAAYVRVSIALRVMDPPPNAFSKEEKEGEKNAGSSKEPNAALRDTALAVLGRETSESLLAPDGKERLKAELKKSLVERVPEIKVADLYFTEFLVQR